MAVVVRGRVHVGERILSVVELRTPIHGKMLAFGREPATPCPAFRAWRVSPPPPEAKGAICAEKEDRGTSPARSPYLAPWSCSESLPSSGRAYGKKNAEGCVQSHRSSPAADECWKTGMWSFGLPGIGEKARLMWKSIRSILGRRGFTLIELMVVVAIISLLSAIALLQFRNYQEKSANAAAVEDMRNVRTVLEAFHADHH